MEPSELAELVVGVARTSELWSPVVRHDPEQRWYAPLLETSQVQVWLISWGEGQALDLHDHGESAGAFVLVRGQLVEHSVRRGRPDRLRSVELGPGRPRSFAPGYVHSLSNPGPQPAVSVHAYSPPLTSMSAYHPVTLEPEGQLPVGPLATVG
jgi:predicted metal-dependent enzyme (double-stranded beta helix superfamily)